MNLDLKTENKTTKAKGKEELTLENVPKAMNYLINEVAEMRVVLEHIESQLGLGVDKHRPIEAERAAEILGLTKNAINKMVRTNRIPYYDKGEKIYFFEDELIKWVEQSRKGTALEKYKGEYDEEDDILCCKIR
jgi:excisionase family DNA binding protein